MHVFISCGSSHTAIASPTFFDVSIEIHPDATPNFKSGTNFNLEFNRRAKIRDVGLEMRSALIDYDIRIARCGILPCGIVNNSQTQFSEIISSHKEMIEFCQT